LSGTGRPSRARRPSTRRRAAQPGSPTAGADLAARLRPVQARLRRELGQARVLAEMVRAVNATLEPARVADAMLTRAAAWLPAPAWAVFAVDPSGQSRRMAARALTPPLERAADAVAAWVLRNGQSYFAANAGGDRRLQGVGSAATAIGLPLVCRGRTFGALVALDRRPSVREPAFASSTLAVLRSVLDPAAFALDNALRVQRAEALSVTDDLTQLYNSRYLSQVLRRETKRASRSGRPLSLLFLDLDGFKAINDVHGHLFGSRALVEAAEVIRHCARETDIVARFGGDEFAIVLPDTGSEGAFAVGERIRVRIAAFSFLAADGLDIRLTASVGVATLPDVAVSTEGLIQAADEAMYRVKERGKNGIHVAGS
jgi:diguanylate cyclase (GGDEF)-like protein